MKSSHLLVLLFVLTLVSLALVLSCGSDDGNTDIIGTDCSLDADCQLTGYMCDVTNKCAQCTYCEIRDDCPESNMTCNTDTNCCKQVLCTDHQSCEGGLFCTEFVCREKSCTQDSDCVRDEGDNSLFCYASVCTEKECETYSDCDTRVCDEDEYVCKNCLSDVDCPEGYPVCSNNGTCMEKAVVDGDSIDDKMGCDEFKDSCMYETLSCFDKLVPSGQDWASCVKTEDSDGHPGYVFTFEDGSRWSSYGDPPFYHIAKGADGCYYKVSLKLGYYEYTSKGGDILGRYSYDVANDLVQITCPNGETGNFSYKDLHDNVCEGFPEGAIYFGKTLGCQDETK